MVKQSAYLRSTSYVLLAITVLALGVWSNFHTAGRVGMYGSIDWSLV